MSVELQLLVQAVVGGIAVKLINMLKKALNPTGIQIPIKIAQDVVFLLDVNLLLALGVCVLLAIPLVFATSMIGSAPVTIEKVISWITLIFTVATAIYNGVQRPEAQK